MSLAWTTFPLRNADQSLVRNGPNQRERAENQGACAEASDGGWFELSAQKKGDAEKEEKNGGGGEPRSAGQAIAWKVHSTARTAPKRAPLPGG